MKILPIIVLYNQSLFNTRTYLSVLRGSKLPFLVYDNSPTAMHSSDEFSHEIKYVSDIENGGVSKAYNYGASYAKENGFDWLLLLDQDTIFPDGALNRYIASQLMNPQIMLFAPVLRLVTGRPFSPTKSFLKHSYPIILTPGKIYPLSKIVPVNSGILVNTDAFIRVEGYDEMVPLDFADFLFIDRFAKKYKSFYLIDLICIQDFSNEERDPDKLLKRFEIFCRGAKNYKKSNYYDSFCFLYVVLRRAMGLTIKTGNPVFIKKVFSDYLS